MAPLVRGEVRGPAVLVADLAGGQPTVEHVAIAVVGHEVSATGVAGDGGEHVRMMARPTGRNPLLLGADFVLRSSSIGTAASRRILLLK